jgi:hypothetical protein
MKKFLMLFVVMFAAFGVGLSLRMALKKWSPGVYSALWGPVLVYQPAPGASADIPSSIDNGVSGKVVAIAESAIEKKTIEKMIEERDNTRDLYATGRIWGNGLSWVVMSDGTVRSMDDNTEPDKPRLERIRRHYMDFEGKRYYYTARKSDPEKQGAGAKGAPERQDTEVPAVAVAAITGRNPTAGRESSGPSAGANVSDAAPSPAGSWYVDQYGVSRLREAPSLKRSF